MLEELNTIGNINSKDVAHELLSLTPIQRQNAAVSYFSQMLLEIFFC